MKKIIVEIVSSNNGGDSRNKSDDGAKDKSSLSKVLNFESTINGYVKRSLGAESFFCIKMGADLIKKTGKQVFDYYISDIGRQMGDSNYQAIVNRKMEIANDVLEVVQGAWAGAAAGSIVPVIGTAIGAIVGAASAGISMAFKYAERERAYQHEMFQQNNSQAYQLARANYSALTGRVR